MIKITDFRKWYQGVKYVFNLECTQCIVSFYNEHLFTTHDKQTIEQLKNDPEHYMLVLFKQKFNLNY